MSERIGIDLGGTKIEGVVLDSNGKPCQRVRKRTPNNYDAIVIAVVSLIRSLQTFSSNAIIGIGCPGHVDTNSNITNSNTQCLNGHALKKTLNLHLAKPFK